MERRRRRAVVLMLILPIVLWMPSVVGAYIALGIMASGGWWAFPAVVLSVMMSPLVVASVAPDCEVQFGIGTGAVLATVHFIAAVVVPFAYDGTRPTGHLKTVLLSCLVCVAMGTIAGMAVSVIRLNREQRRTKTIGNALPSSDYDD